MKFTDKITIALPVYERKEYFSKALNSALNQSIKCEIIVVDNASSHNYFKEYCKNKLVKYYRNEKNIGMFGNWNLCYKLAKTEFVLLLGDDDKLDNNYVKYFLEALEKYPDLDIYFSDFNCYLYDKNEIQQHKHVLPFGYMNKNGKILEYGLLYKLGYPIISSTIKKQVFLGYYEKFHASNDWLWIYSNAFKFNIFGDSRILYSYGIHKRQDTSNKMTSGNCQLSIAYIYDCILKDYFKENKKYRKLAKKNANYSMTIFRTYVDHKRIKEILASDSIYGRYLHKKLNSSLFSFSIILLPQKISVVLLKLHNKLIFHTNNK